ncbi:Hypothetical predicted protein, partial [Paramuricea clavata]
HWSEGEAEIPAGITDTMLTAPDFVTDNERQYILNIAPGEGNRPVSIFRDKYSEELAYPGIFLGQKHPDNSTRLRDVHYKTQWIHLLRILGKLIDKKQYTDNELENLNWEDKTRLIQGDPTGSIGLNIRNAPTFGEDSDCDVVSFIDNIITCEKPTENPELLALVNRQVHRHSHTCRKKSKSVCRFDYPQPPMRSTKIIYPLDIDMDDNEVDQHKDTWKFIKKHLNDMKKGEDITFDQLLINLKLTEQNYLLAVQSSLKTPTIFLKRKPNELRINNYNACMSQCMACKYGHSICT